MTENMKKFLELASQNVELAKMLENAEKEDIIAAAKTVEIELTDADLKQETELSDDELDAVAGGGRCICSFGGGGKADEGEKNCACVMGGGGEYKEGDVRCVCIIGGEGFAY